MEFIGLIFILHVFFFWAYQEKNFGLVDIAWGLFFVNTAVLSFTQPNGYKWVVLLAVILWGLRLSTYLWIRNRGKPEDYRYQKFRASWQPRPNLQAYFKVFWLQAMLSFIISLSFWTFFRSSGNVVKLSFYVGVLLFLFGFFWEAWADWIMYRFKQSAPAKDEICTRGPWKFSRHPNYFGEIVLWYGIWLMCFHPYRWWTVIAPLTIHLLILFVSGVPLLEEKMKQKEKYQAYFKNTHSLIPKFFS